MIALNRFCEGEGINIQRLYEWLRHRKISISDYKDSLSGTPIGVRNHRGRIQAWQKVRHELRSGYALSDTMSRE